VKSREVCGMAQHVDIVDSYQSRRIMYWVGAFYADFMILLLGIFFFTTNDSFAFDCTIIALCVSILATIFGLRYVEQNAKKADKRFSISQKFIEIARWNRRVFHIEWSDLASIYILKEDRGDNESSSIYYAITFKTSNASKTIKFDAILNST